MLAPPSLSQHLKKKRPRRAYSWKILGSRLRCGFVLLFFGAEYVLHFGYICACLRKRTAPPPCMHFLSNVTKTVCPYMCVFLLLVLVCMVVRFGPVTFFSHMLLAVVLRTQFPPARSCVKLGVLDVLHQCVSPSKCLGRTSACVCTPAYSHLSGCVFLRSIL